MSMTDARLGHLTLRLEAVEAALGMSDDPPPGVTTIVSRLEQAEQDISDLEDRRAATDSEETWALVRDLVRRRNAGPGSTPMILGYRQVKALADLIEDEWGTQS
jgi:hypothetical protein